MADEVQALSTGAAVAVADPSPAEEPKEQPTPAEVPTGDTPAEQPAPEAQETTELDLEEVPSTSGDFPKYKELFPKFPELRHILGREAAFSDIGSYGEVKGIVERVPTLADAESLATAAQNHRALGETFRNDPVGFAETLRENDANGFTQLVSKLPEILAETDTRLYSEQARYYTGAVLDNLVAMAQQAGDKELLTALQMVSQNLGYRLGTSQTSRSEPNSEVAKLRRELAERDRASSSVQVESFWSQVDGTFAQTMYGEIEGAIKKAIPNVSEAQLKRMAIEAWTKTNETMESQPQTMAQVKGFRERAEKGSIGIADFKAALDYCNRRGRLTYPGAVKATIKEWTDSVLKLNAEKTDKAKGIAERSRDAGTGVQGSTSAAVAGNGKQPKRTFNSVMDSLAKGTYQPAAAK